MALDPRLVTDKERTLFSIGAIWSAICWLLVIVSIFGGLYALLIFVFVLMAHALLLARIRGNGVRVSKAQLPDLYERCEAAAKKLGMTEMPEVYLVQSGGVLNAFATKLLSRKFVVIYSGLVSACEDPQELDFVVGHEIGHLAAGHLAWNAFLLPFHLMPWLGAAYSRAREYTCDRCGFAVVGELEPSSRALVVLAAGGKYAAKVDLSAFAEQRKEFGYVLDGDARAGLEPPVSLQAGRGATGVQAAGLGTGRRAKPVCLSPRSPAGDRGRRRVLGLGGISPDDRHRRNPGGDRHPKLHEIQGAGCGVGARRARRSQRTWRSRGAWGTGRRGGRKRCGLEEEQQQMQQLLQQLQQMQKEAGQGIDDPDFPPPSPNPKAPPAKHK